MKILPHIALYASLAVLLAFSPRVCGQTGPDRIYGSKVMKTESREVRDFSNIKVSSGLSVHIRQGQTEGVTIEAEDNLLPYVITEVAGNTLEIKLTPSIAFFDIRPVKVSVRCKSLDAITASTGSSVTADGPLSGAKMACTLLAGSSLRSALSFRELLIELQGGSYAALQGKADKAVITVAGGSMLRAKGLSLQSCTISATGSSFASVQANQDLSVVASGVSTVRYSGHPEIREKKTTDLAKVKGR